MAISLGNRCDSWKGSNWEILRMPGRVEDPQRSEHLAHVADHGVDLLVAQRGTEARHRATPLDDDRRHGVDTGLAVRWPWPLQVGPRSPTGVAAVTPRALSGPQLAALDQRGIGHARLVGGNLRRLGTGTAPQHHQDQRRSSDGRDLPTSFDLHRQHAGHDTGRVGMNPFHPRRGSRLADIAFVVVGLVVCVALVAWAAMG